MNQTTRRHILLAGGAGLAALASASSQAFSATAPGLLLRADVTLGGKKYSFREESGRNLGDFVSVIGGFTQSCVLTEVQGCPLKVFFRPDRSTGRVEVVFELGKIFAGTPANLGAYVVVIFRGTTVLATIDVPAHYWFSRWRWQSEPRPVVGNVDTLIAQNLLPPYDRASVLAALKPPAIAPVAVGTCPTSPTSPVPIPTDEDPYMPATPAVPYTVMGLAGVNPYMPQSGERPDIGIVTEPQAEYICTARQSALETLRAQAEAAGTMPWHLRDENTNAPINLRAYSKANWYAGTTVGAPYVKTTKSPITIDSAHQPALAYVPYILTGDPYHLEDLQFQANWNFGCLISDYRMSIPQSRAFAWNLRTLAQAARITPTAVPSWILPRLYFSAFLTDYRRFFETDYVNSMRAERVRFSTTRNIDTSPDGGVTAPKGTWTDPWEDEFVATIIGWVVSMGFPEWQTSFNWKIRSTVARTSKTSGWKRAQATPYRLIVRETASSSVAMSWAEAWEITKRVTKISYLDINTWAPNDMTYLTYTRGALVYIDKLKAWDVTENLAWATGQINARKWDIAYKWRLGRGLG